MFRKQKASATPPPARPRIVASADGGQHRCSGGSLNAGAAHRSASSGERSRRNGPVVDLGQERRVAAALAELEALTGDGTVDYARTLAMLAGELETRPVSEADVSTTFRLPAALLTRADELAVRLPAPPGVKLSRSSVLRAALERGLSSLEADAARTALPAPDLAGLAAELDALRARVGAALGELGPTDGAPPRSRSTR